MYMGVMMKLTGAVCILFPLVIFTAGLFLKKANKRTRWSKIFIFVLYIGVILYLTVLRREEGSVHEFVLKPFWSYAEAHDPQYRWQIYMNIFLFIPFGFMLGWTMNRKFLQTLLIGLIFSALLEVVQYIFCLGLCETDDVIHNTLGTVIGYEYWNMLRRLVKKRRSE